MEKRFTKNIVSKGTIFKFHFLKLLTNTYPRYLIIVQQGSKAHPFYLELKRGHWDLVNPQEQPHWLLGMKTQLTEAILEREHYTLDPLVLHRVISIVQYQKNNSLINKD